MRLVSGIIQYISPLTRELNLNDIVKLKANISDYYYVSQYYTSLSLTWYHNNTRITINERISITDCGTTLTIADTVETDAGKYQVRIDSMNFSSGVDPPECPKNILPLFEDLALHAPVTFLLQQSVTPIYNPEDVITTQYIIPDYLVDDQPILLLNTSSRINTSFIRPYYSSKCLYKNTELVNSGKYNYTALLFDEEEIGAMIGFKYNNSRNIIGDYVFQEYWHLNILYNGPNCNFYIRYTPHYFYSYKRISYFSIILSGKSTSQFIP